MQGMQKISASGGAVFENVLLDADALGTLSSEQRAKLSRVVGDAVRQAARTLERMRPGSSRYIMKERIDFPIDLEAEPGALANALAQAIVRRIEVRIGARITDGASPTVPSMEGRSFGLAEPRGAAARGEPRSEAASDVPRPGAERGEQEAGPAPAQRAGSPEPTAAGAAPSSVAGTATSAEPGGTEPEGSGEVLGD
ncbi:MAG: hypothetical protein D6776_09990 [Planctomycetota bacterium]|nr:MAG: hypothetical protein D6776_09990 [Planctomycetota bacterium]